MTGQGPAAVQLLKTKATQPGVTAKVRHDYAVVLAMAGNRPEAERVLREDLSPDDARQVLDSVTGASTRTARDASPEPGRASVASRDWDFVPPDVVQVPDVPPQALPPGRTAQSAAPPTVTAAPRTAAATMAAPPPMVVRPQAASEPDSDAPLTQPVNPVAAAIANQHSLALPIQSAAANTASAGRALAVGAAPNETAVVPAVVAMPAAIASATQSVRRVAATPEVTADAGRIALPEAPPPPPVLRPVPLPPAYQPLKAAARIEPTAPQPVAAAMASPVAAPLAARAEGARANDARAESARVGDARFETATAIRSATQASPIVYVAAATVAALAHASPEAPLKVSTLANVTQASDNLAAARTRTAGGDESRTMVQFAATSSEESARSFWQVLVHRFPDALGRRDPVVLRFEHDGTVFWRVRTEGFADLAEAQTLCARMRADGQPCFVPRS
jgi:hypothetical protein